MNIFFIGQIILAIIFFLSAQFSVCAQTNAADSNGTNATRQKSLPEADAQNPMTMTIPKTVPQTANNYVRPTANERFKRYLNKTVGTGLIGVGIAAGINQIANVPPDWKRGGSGFARRLGSSFGENAIQETITYGLEEAFKLDGKFYKSRKRDFGSRLKNGLLSGITARTPSGRRVFNPAPIIGGYAANIISTETWYPKRYNYKDGLRQGTQNVGFTVAFGLLNEFLFKRK